MNIWALQKDTNIKHLLLTLHEVFKPDAYDIIQNPNDDQRAIRLANPAFTETVLYIYTYGQMEYHYGVHIEYPNLQETNFYDTIESIENATLEDLAAIIITKLEISKEMILKKKRT